MSLALKVTVHTKICEYDENRFVSYSYQRFDCINICVTLTYVSCFLDFLFDITAIQVVL